MLHMFIPILTSRVFMHYEKNLKKKRVTSVLVASIKWTKESKLSKEISNLIDKEKSISAPQMNNIVTTKVQKEVQKAKPQLARLDNKTRKATKILKIKNK